VAGVHLSARIFVAILCSCLVLAVRNLLLRFPVDHGLELRNKLGDLRGDRHDLIKSFSAHTRRQSRVLAVGTSARLINTAATKRNTNFRTASASKTDRAEIRT